MGAHSSHSGCPMPHRQWVPLAHRWVPVALQAASPGVADSLSLSTLSWSLMEPVFVSSLASQENMTLSPPGGQQARRLHDTHPVHQHTEWTPRILDCSSCWPCSALRPGNQWLRKPGGRISSSPQVAPATSSGPALSEAGKFTWTLAETRRSRVPCSGSPLP